MPKKKLLEDNPLFEKTSVASGGKPETAKPVTYYLPPDMIKDLKRLARERDKNISELVREILGDHLSQITTNRGDSLLRRTAPIREHTPAFNMGKDSL